MLVADNPLHTAAALVIEGNAQSRAIIVSQLRDLGVGNVAQCARVHDARRRLEAQHYDVVVCEQSFDKESYSGQELLDDLRRHQILPFHTVFMMLTAEATYSKVAEAAESALDAYLLKPHTAASLGERIQLARQRKKVLHAIFSAIDAQDFDHATALCLARFETRQDYWLYAARIGAELLLRAGHIGEAQRLYEAVIEAKTLPWARLGVARAQLESGVPAKAVTTIESLLADDDSYADAYDVMGRAQFELGQFDQALSTYAMATRLTPHSVSRLLKHGMLAFYGGDRGEGVALLDRAARLGVDSKLFDPQALVLLALARFDNNDTRGLQRCVDQLARTADRSFEPERPRRLHEVAAAINNLHNKVNAAALDTTVRLMREVLSPGFDTESACNLVTLMVRMAQRGATPPDAETAITAIALRFGTSRAMSELLACAAKGNEPWAETLRQGHARVLGLSEQAMRLSLKGDPTGTVEQLLTEAERTRNAKLIESAHQVLQRHAERIATRETLQQRVDAMRQSYRARPLRLGDHTGVTPGGVALPAGYRAPERVGLLDARPVD
ncbi:MULTISPECIES: response regulator [Hydrogenophaga]|uniref:Response regulator receiver domain-containing protein n=1 Tax=Hydrogenophaga intermedia TaxID=65786 RepID=A0A1L1P7I2_HYDIT|nr:MULTISPECIES: response regulator [Hydrogenophaga]AOS80214.1 response regulator receiver protein [Hydrogenophaga sp. PBC]TMU77891.1 response regulator [Hydrogenophaga intermedia]CDN85732.1 Response regulator receiver domain-containing protein [Hydrogenophaga intermedia]